MYTQSRDERLLSEINVTPFVDVMLVLLIIFMVTAPMLQQGIDVDLPNVAAKDLPAKEEKLILTITKKKKIFVGLSSSAPTSSPHSLNPSTSYLRIGN